MAEGRRIPFETVKPSAKEIKVDEEKRTIRFSLDLHESNEKSCPEFSYADLFRSALTKEKKSEEADPFNDEDDEDQVRRMAKKFEEKYGPKPGKTKKKVGHYEDYIDRGMGYDENDPFIDNDEAYDELVPSTLTTQFGGFYINSGELEFRAVSDADSSEPFRQRKRRRKFKENFADKEVKRRKRLLQSETAAGSPPPDGENNTVVPKKRGRKPIDRSNSVASSADESALNKARRKAQPTVAVLLQERKAQLQQQQQNQNPAVKTDEGAPPLPPPIPLPSLPPLANVTNHISEVVLDSGEESPLPVPIIASSSEDEGNYKFYGEEFGQVDAKKINEIIESVIKNTDVSGVTNGDIVLSGSGSESGEDFKGIMKDFEAPKLPDNLPADLEDTLKKIKQVALVSAQGKCKFFNDGVNHLLLSIEVKTRELACAQRSMVYSHLASYLPCTKDTLLKRAKKLRLDQEGGKLADPMQKLRKAVNEAMPGMIEKYETALQNSKDSSKAENGNTDENSVVRRKFDWTDHLRSLLCEVVRIKLKCYEVLKTRTQSAEEYLQQFLEYEIRALWPPNWMTTKILLKQSRNAYAYLSNRQKKPWLLVKRPLVQSLDGQTPSGNASPTQGMIEEYEEIPLGRDCEDDSQSSLKLVIASPPPMPQIDPVDQETPVILGGLAEVTKMKADLYSELVSPEKSDPVIPSTSNAVVTLSASSSSPNKRIFTLMNSEEAAQLAQNSSKQSSYADEMLNRIICASLANFPNSGSSLAVPEIGGKPIKADLNFSSLETLSPSTPTASSKSASEFPKSSTTLPSSTATTHSVSILKSNYSPQSQGRTSNRASVLEHGSNLITSIPKSVSKSGATVPTMPYQVYEFQEAFKRSLAKDSLSDTSVGRNKFLLKRQQAEKSTEEPMNFKTTSSSSTSYVASQELNRIAVSSSPILPTRDTPPNKVSRTPRVSPDVSFQANLFPEGMKGFPMPLKSNSVINTNATSLPPPPAHGFSSRRSPSEKIFTSPHRSGTSGGSPTSLHHHSPREGSSAHRSSYKATSSLPQYTDPTIARSIIQGPWRTNSRARASPPTVTSPSQYQSGSVLALPKISQNYSIPPSSLSSSSPSYNMPGSPKLLQSQRGSISSGSVKSPNIPTPAHQSATTAQTPVVSRSQVYSSMYGNSSFTSSPRNNPQSAHQRIP